MKWLSELWTKSATAVQVALILGVVILAMGLLIFTGSLDTLGLWLAGN